MENANPPHPDYANPILPSRRNDALFTKILLSVLSIAFMAWAGVVYSGVQSVNKTYVEQSNALARVEERIQFMSLELTAIKMRLDTGVLPLAKERLDRIQERVDRLESRPFKGAKSSEDDGSG